MKKDRFAQFWEYVYIAPTDPTVWANTCCWIWRGPPKRRFHKMSPYRYIYRLKYGSPGQGSLHHTCHNHNCVNPDHLIPLTKEEHRSLHKQFG